ncbi:arsenosugar biosynthesis radical SAM (seleno)protein ArsS [Daejeonella sp.]|uniref:arsenosugar biosynthesis radical SAM (seleno)protein ArsS n=1 Tax=Daejeonella sp. TaxID=2805397 RepID=UPI00271DFEFC|nr:arsenosugar biosynthesis radical SAM (seleno)protein ArsS [Daejeonella sp.]MDO8992132.1 arsenosugar biosynthesis radical SAM protein ArsS [Daejeonella sp.]MDP2413232.1 arsenosugar biosynthesis radical SAM protein ArsS [Daejeonella sp.]
MIKSLKVLHHPLADSENQLEVLENSLGSIHLTFSEKLAFSGIYPLKASGIDIMQLNLGKMCNQTCKHCHVDAGPDRKEMMSRITMQLCLDALKNSNIDVVDLTGGAPELNPDFRWLVEQIKKLGKHVMVRCNLTIILANKRFHDLPEFFKHHQVEVVSSLPGFTQDRTDRQRGNGVFEDSIKALQMLNHVGYGQEGSGLVLNLVYNPAGAFLPPSQVALEKEYKMELASRYDIVFNQLFAITNMPISRYLDYLLSSGNYSRYMDKLISAFNPASVQNLMCRNTLSVGWDGSLYDCDFNQMLDLKVSASDSQHISDFDFEILNNRNIVVKQHCFGCTAGEGSSCGGSLTI